MTRQTAAYQRARAEADAFNRRYPEGTPVRFWPGVRSVEPRESTVRGRAWALLSGRDYVIPDDVKGLAESVLAHRLSLSSAARLRGVSAESVVAALCQTSPVPVEAE